MSALPPPEERAGYVRAMFARIVDRYDLLNDLMTLGRHRHWKRVAVHAAGPAGARVLDLGCGTGDLTRELARQGARVAVGADFTPQMLYAARALAAARGVTATRFVAADALRLPFADGSFECVTSGFLVRNVSDPGQAFREMHRVLAPGGRVVCLEAARRDGALGRLLHAGFEVSARVLGRVVAGDASAYSYLPRSAAAFASPPELATIISAAGFQRVQYRTFGLGLIAIHRAWR